MQLYLIRHAESENNAKSPHDRVEDPPLTAVGRLQAQHLGDWIKTLPIDALLCSPVRRAIQTTRFITQATGHHTHVWADIFEEGGIYRGHGPAATEGGPGLSRAQIIAHLGDVEHSTLDDSITDQGWWNRDRESTAEATERAAAVLTRLKNRFGESQQTVAAVIHADFKRKLLSHMLADAVDVSRLGALRNTGVTKVDYDRSGWRLDWFNSVTHLPARLITGNET
jgi:2,3-bisphosphoglycerate-dependent phosphoglycerate mutase